LDEDQEDFFCEKTKFLSSYNKKTDSMRRSASLKRMKTKVEKWEYASKIVVYDWKSLYLFDEKTRCRRILVAIVESKIFENIILVLIILNSLCYTIRDYAKPSGDSECFSRNWWLEYVEHVFSFCFMIECVLKIISQGFIKHYNSYLRN